MSTSSTDEHRRSLIRRSSAKGSSPSPPKASTRIGAPSPAGFPNLSRASPTASLSGAPPVRGPSPLLLPAALSLKPVLYNVLPASGLAYAPCISSGGQVLTTSPPSGLGTDWFSGGSLLSSTHLSSSSREAR